MQHIFITGATGVLGHRLVEQLVNHGHTVYGLVRDATGAETIRRIGAVPRQGDVLDKDSLQAAVHDIEIDVFVHAATAIPTSRKPSADEWAQNDVVRLQGAKNIVSSLGNRINRFVFPSVVWVARQPNGGQFDESATRRPDRSTRSAAAVEKYLEKTSKEYEFGSVILRCGFFYAADSTHTRQWGLSLLAGDMRVVAGGLLGRTDATLSFIHVADAARAFADAIESNTTGIYHIVDDNPVTLMEVLTAFAEALNAPPPGRIPGWLTRFLIGNEAVDLLTKSMPTTNEKFQRETGWKPNYPSYEEGVEQIVSQWRESNSIPPRIGDAQ